MSFESQVDFVKDANVDVEESEKYTTPPPLAKIGLCTTRRMTEMRAQRQLKQPKKLVFNGYDELIVKRPIFQRTRPKLQQKIAPEAAINDEEDISMDEEIEEEPLAPKIYYTSVGSRLHNFLKQLSSHRWIWCEFVESFVDKPILAGAYDMERFITECCPLIKARCLPRRGWQLLRRNMGKARRFSPAFIELERVDLERTRRIVRELQQGRFNVQEDTAYMDQIPKRIPLPLAMQTKVTSFLQGHANMGIINGRIISYEPQDSSYLVRFEIAGRRSILCLPDFRLQADQDTAGLPLTIMLHAIDSQPAETETDKTELFGNRRYTKVLLEALVKMQKLLDIKLKAVRDIAQMNVDYEGGLPTNMGGNRRDPKMIPQREELQRRYAANMITLHRVNTDVIAPLQHMHEHLAKYRRKEDQIPAKTRPASEIYQRCRNQAELDLKTAEQVKSLKLESDCTRDLVFNMQTILHITGELGRNNHPDMDVILKDGVEHLINCLPPGLGDYFKDMWASMEPMRQRMLSTFNIVQKPKRYHITHAPPSCENGMYSIVVEEELEPEFSCPGLPSL